MLGVLAIQVAAKEAQREAAIRVIEQEAELMNHERELRRRVSKIYVYSMLNFSQYISLISPTLY